VKVVLDDSTNRGGNIATIKSRATDINGHPIGRAHNNPMMDSRECEVEMEDRTIYRLFANKIAENIYL